MQEKPTKPQLCVLIVEDSEDDAFLLLRELRKSGHEVVYQTVSSLDGLAEALLAKPWQLLISDYNLPGFSALDVLHLVQQQGLDLPVVIVSGVIGEDLAVEAMRAGAHDYIMKDNLARLNPAIERELEELEVHRQRRRAEAALKESEQRFRQLAETIEEVFWLIDCETQQAIYVSPAYEKLWERPAHKLLESLDYFLDAVHPEDFSRVQEAVERSGWAGFTDDYRIQRPDGTVRWVYTRSFPIADENGNVYRVAGLSVDITGRKRHEAEMKKMSRALEQTADVVMVTDRDGLIEYVNQACEDVTGYNREEMLGRSPNILKSGMHREEFYRRLWRSIANGVPFSDIFINRRKSGDLYYEAKTITPVRDERGDITHFVATGKEITEQLRRRQDVHRAVHYDAVTGLPNQIFLLNRLNQVLMHAQRTSQPVGVLCVGFDLGELIGDGEDSELTTNQLLPLIAQMLAETVGTRGTVARLERDEFAVVYNDADDGFAGIEALARSLVAAFGEPINSGGYEMFLSPSIGISVYPDNGDTSEILLRNARLAMEYAHSTGRKRYSFYQLEMCRKNTNRLSS